MNPFLRVIESLNRHGVRYVIVGGFAAVMHGHNRATRDLDIVVDLSPGEARKAIEALVGLEMKPRAPVDPFGFADEKERQRWLAEKGAVVFTMIDSLSPTFAVDLFVESPIEWETFHARAATMSAGGQTFRVCAIDDLIDMKTRTGRPQDLMDVQALHVIKSRGGIRL